MNTVTKAELKKINKLAAWLAEVSEGYAEDGDLPYPDDVDVVAGHVVIAALDPFKEYNAPLLKVIPPEEALAKYDEVVAFRKQHKCDLWEECGL